MIDDTLTAQLRAYATQLDELPAHPHEAAPVVAMGWRPPRWSRREWTALAAAIAVLLVVAAVRIVDQTSGTGPSVGTGGRVAVHAVRGPRDLGAQVDRTIDAPGGRTIVDVAPREHG